MIFNIFAFSRFKPWQVLLVVMLGLGLLLYGYTASFSHKSLHLECHAQLHQPPFSNTASSLLRHSLTLVVQVRDKKVNLDYRYGLNDKALASINYSGVVKNFEIGTMTYQFDLAQANVKMDLLQTEIPEPIREDIKRSRAALIALGKMSFNMQIVDINRIDDYTLIEFKPSGHLWACSSR
ncbi:hypothetical protein [Shewanella putrefaciens]|uniref:hypothetical protein n=1 Tax=Shewanella putrefaciens TaxID=24 RepID=UPI0018E7C057|nr:hypothetical protein [Shewanella putrefaciens]